MALTLTVASTAAPAAALIVASTVAPIAATKSCLMKCCACLGIDNCTDCCNDCRTGGCIDPSTDRWRGYAGGMRSVAELSWARSRWATPRGVVMTTMLSDAGPGRVTPRGATPSWDLPCLDLPSWQKGAVLTQRNHRQAFFYTSNTNRYTYHVASFDPILQGP